MVLAAGSGERLGYLGGVLPKTMVPVQGRPLLWHALRTLAAVGATDARVGIQERASLADAYLSQLSPRTVGLRSIEVVRFRRPTRGPTETLARTLGQPPAGTFAVVLGDDLTQATNLRRLLRVFEERQATVAQAVVEEHERTVLRRTCEIDVAPGGWIRTIHEKPSRPRWPLRGCGLYLFRGSAFGQLVRGAGGLASARSMSDLVAEGARQGRALALPLQGRNINVNTVGDVLEAWTLVPRDRGAEL